MNNIFVTGGTGFLGSILINEILSSSGDIVHVLVRDKFGNVGRNRLISILEGLNDGKKLDDGTRNRIKTYAGDITHKGLGLVEDAVNDLIETVDTIYHCAAGTDLNWPLKKARKLNVEGTINLLGFAMKCREKGRLRKVNHISTVYIVGTKRCKFKEMYLDLRQGFNNTYEQSKFEAEKVVHEYRKKGLDVDVFRPSILVGRYKDGKTTNFKMFYQPLHFFSHDLFEKIPARGHSKVNIINVDIAARAIFLIARSSTDENMTYHIVSPRAPSFEFLLSVAGEFFGFKKPELISPNEMDIRREYSFVKAKMLEPYLPYFNYITEFDMGNTRTQLKQHKFKFPEFDEKNLIRLFEYCERVGFIKRKKK